MDNQENKEKAVDQPTNFTKAELIANAAAFGVLPEIVAGALHDKEEATKEETKKAIKAFLKKPKEGKEDKKDKGAKE